MADWKNKRELQRERDRADEKEKEYKNQTSIPSQKSKGGSPESEHLRKLIEQVDPLMDRIHTLYNQYLSGAEKSPPNTLREQLEKMIQSITASSKPTASLRFQASSVQSKYTTYRERWDKLLRDLEAGRIKRAGK